MATVDDAAREALAAVDTDAGFLRAVDWASDRYRELTNRSRYRALRKVGEIVVPAKITTGTITTTRGSNIVTGDATAQAEWVQHDLVRRHFRASPGRAWYEIEGMVVSGATTTLRLKSPFSENAVSGGAYEIVQRWTRVDDDARSLGKFVWMRFGRELEKTTLTELDVLFPDRLLVTAGGPFFVAEIGVDDDGVRLVEIYPYASTSEIFHYVYWPHSPRLRPGDSLPEGIDPYVLREGVVMDIYRWEMSRAIRAGNIEAAAVWRNEFRSQRQSWEQAIRDAGKADKGQTDVSLILRSGTFRRDQFNRFNNSARTEIFIRGNRP
jgi:hypothetical protein